MRVLAGKMRMTELSRELLPVLHPIFEQYFTEVFSLSANDDLGTLAAWSNTVLRPEHVRTSHLLLKAISRLAVADIGMISRSTTSQGGASANMAQAFFRSTPRALQTLKDTRLAYLRLLRSPHAAQHTSATTSAALVTALTKHLYAFGKFFLSLIQRDNGKAAFWHGWADVVGWYWTQAKDVNDHSLSVPRDDYANHAAAIDYPPRFVVQALVLLKHSLAQWKGNRPEAASSSRTTLPARPPTCSRAGSCASMPTISSDGAPTPRSGRWARSRRTTSSTSVPPPSARSWCWRSIQSPSAGWGSICGSCSKRPKSVA